MTTATPARNTPWAAIGTPTPNAMTAQEAIVAGGLDWEVSLKPLYVEIGDKKKKVSGRFGAVRSSDEAVMGIVGTRYVPFQNREVFSFANSLVPEGDAVFETVGSGRNGKVLFCSMRVPTNMLLDGGDAHDMYLLFRTSHDGTMGIGAAATPIRVACTNTITMATRMAKHKWSVAHVSNAADKLAEAHNSMQRTLEYAEAFVVMGNKLIATKVTDDMIVKLLNETMIKRPQTQERIERIMDYYHNSPTNGYQGTAWGAMNGATEYLDHGRETTSPEAVFNQIMDGEIASFRNRFANALLSV